MDELIRTPRPEPRLKRIVAYRMLPVRLLLGCRSPARKGLGSPSV